jgi:hypothetical protein
MTRKRDLKTWFLLVLRHAGMLCRKPKPEKPGLRIAYSIYPEREITPIQAEIHVWIETKKTSRKNCKFDSRTMSCPCGVDSIEAFASACNNTREK